ncbi:MAG: hypothetical protein KGR42_05315 [Acidobacteria bacterium]|nr:hypothetical protein [Acidobacteriota bacterium]
MSTHRFVQVLAVITFAGSLFVATPGLGGASSLARQTSSSAIVCAKVPSTVPAHHGFTVTTSLDGTSVRDATPASTPIPTPYGGVPGNGVITLRSTRSSSTTTLHLPPSFSGTALTSLCLLATSSRPALLVETYSGGAHCCVDTVLYASASTTSSYHVALLESLTESGKPTGPSEIPYDPNQGVVPRVLGNQTVLVGGDGNFPYTFGCYACTPSPLVISALRGTRVVNVSANYPLQMRHDAALLWSDVRASLSPSTGYASLFGSLAAWTADECTLHQGGSAWREVKTLAAKGYLSDARYHQAIFLPKGSYLPDLDHFLLTHGYCQGQIPARVA